MRKIMLSSFLLLCLISGEVSGQAPIVYDHSQHSLMMMPPSPTAAELGKYGDIPIGLFTGAMTYNIPIHELTCGALKLPISLNYSTNGIKVSESASNVGMSWTLNAGGVITRTILGGDDLKEGALMTPPGELDNPNYYTTANQDSLSSFLNNAEPLQQLEPDVYYFNFGDYSGKFIIGYDGTIQTIPYMPLKIQIQPSGMYHKFLITAPNGEIYYFEKHETLVYQQEGTNCDPGTGNQYGSDRENSWYLTKIKSPLNDSITFTYSNLSYSYYSAVTQNITVFDSYSILNIGCQVPQYGNPSFFPNISSCKLKTQVQTGLILNTIKTSGGEKVVFDNTDRLDMPGNKKTTSIRFFSAQDSTTPYKQYNLSYIYDIHNYRMYLNDLKQVNGSAIDHKYSFEYNDINALPVQTSYSQDNYGYYNGKANSDFFVPRIPTDLYFKDHGADRDCDGYYSIKGALIKITYPTGGYSNIQYESHLYKKVDTVNEEIIDTISGGVAGWGIGTNTTSGITIMEDSIITPNMTNGQLIDHTQIIVKAQYRNFQYPDSIDSDLQSIEYEVIDANTGQPVGGTILYPFSSQAVQGSLFASTPDFPLGRELDFDCTLHTNTKYRIKLTIHGSNQVFGSIQIMRPYGTGQYHNVVKHTNWDFGGARVKSIANYDPFSGNTFIKKYYYDYLENISPNRSGSSMVMPQNRINLQKGIMATHYFCGIPPPNSDPSNEGCLKVNYETLSSNVIYRSMGGSHICYNSVVEGNGNNFENGGTEHKFMGINAALPTEVYNSENDRFIDAPMTNVDYMNGTETYTSEFRKSGSTFVKLREIFSNYTIDTIHNAKDISGFQIVKKYTDIYPCFLGGGNKMELFKVAAYKNISRWSYLNQKKTIDYDMNGANPVTLVENFYYDNPDHAQLTRDEQRNSDGSFITELTTYPKDYSNGTPFIDNMKTANLISFPIEQVKYRTVGSTKSIVSGKITTYKTGGKGMPAQQWLLETTSPLALSTFKFSDRALGILPVGGTATAFSKDSKYKLRVNYDKYDINGNLLNYTADGMTEVLLWGYNHSYPVANIQNIDTAALTAYLTAHPTVQAICDNPASDAALRMTIQQLRAQFPDAAITGFTYKPPLGITSRTEPNGTNTYYEYDAFGRLSVIRDDDQAIIQSFTYKYQGQ